jgi:hypothetical protein
LEVLGRGFEGFGIGISGKIWASINKGQLENKEGHKPNGIMDPYND